jgi:DNA-binding NarL/FixJ family response regulator
VRSRSEAARERQVLDLVASGKLNKQIAAELGVAEKTIKVHRGRVMKKMQVCNSTGPRAAPITRARTPRLGKFCADPLA